MGRLFLLNLEGKIYSCRHCKTHLALCEDVVSKSFQCRHGKAYLFNKVVNVSPGEKEDRMMMTGLHTVADIYCVKCGSYVGWKYVTLRSRILKHDMFRFLHCCQSPPPSLLFQEVAYEKNQKYKEGKSVLERYKVSGPDGNNYWVAHEAQAGASDAEDA